MKAIRVEEFGGPEVMKLVEVPQPRPEAGQVLVRMHAAGVNPVETYIRAGTYPRKPALPFTPGNDGAGVVEQVGDPDVQATGRAIGFTRPGRSAGRTRSMRSATRRRCIRCRRMFRSRRARRWERRTRRRIEGCSSGRRRSRGETVLVHGASGGVGTAAVQLARARGLRVLGTAGTDRGRELVREQGAHEVFDHRAPDYLAQILEATSGRGVDVILEMLANVNLGKDLTILAPRGRVVVIGNRGRVEIDARDTMSRDADIRGMVLPNTSAGGDGEHSRGAGRRFGKRHVASGDRKGIAAGGSAAGASGGDGAGSVWENRVNHLAS